MAPPTPNPIPRRRRRGWWRPRAGRVRVLGRGGGERAAAQQLGAVVGVGGVVARGLEDVEAGAEVGELGAEVADALEGFVLFGRVELLLG